MRFLSSGIAAALMRTGAMYIALVRGYAPGFFRLSGGLFAAWRARPSGPYRGLMRSCGMSGAPRSCTREADAVRAGNVPPRRLLPVSGRLHMCPGMREEATPPGREKKEGWMGSEGDTLPHLPFSHNFCPVLTRSGNKSYLLHNTLKDYPPVPLHPNTIHPD